MTDTPDLHNPEVHPDTQVPDDPHDVEAELDLNESLSLAAALSGMATTGGVHDDDVDVDDVNQTIDPDTLANLAALSRIQEEDGVNGDDDALMGDDDPDNDFSSLLLPHISQTEALTREQVQELVDNLGAAHREEDEAESQRQQEAENAEAASQTQQSEDTEQQQQSDEEENDTGADDTRQEDSDYRAPRTYYENGKLKRRRNRTVLSCTECHRRKQHCDRNIPCSRCIKRGVPSMCRMDTPHVPQRKKRRIEDDVPVNYELSLRVQALQSLLRTSSAMDDDASQNVAMDTIMHATRAANNGQPDAARALARLSHASSGLGISAMSNESQGSLLMDVLQQLSAASMTRPSNSNHAESRDMWASIPMATSDTLLAVENAFKQDPSITKLNLSLPGFRETSGKVFIPPTMRVAEKRLREESLMTYGTPPIEGYAPFLEAGTRFAYGEENVAFRNRRIAAIQAVSITGALRLAAMFLSRFPGPAGRLVYVPEPSLHEDVTALRDGGLEAKFYRFLSQKDGSVDWDGMRDDLQQAPQRSAVLLHVGGSMPTGLDLASHQWRQLTTLALDRQLIPIVVMAFQGLSSGDAARDAQPLRFMVHEGVPVILVQSFDAMMGLYTDSPAIVSIPTQSIADRDRVDSQLRSFARTVYVHPPLWGAQLAHMVLSDPKLYPSFLAELDAMSKRLRSVRDKLFEVVTNKLKTPGPWSHLKRATGMYCTLLLPPTQIEALTSRRNVHLLPEGCVALGCLDVPKIEALARSVDWVVREGIREAEEQQAEAYAMELAIAAAKEQEARQEAEARAAAEEAAAAAAQAEDALLMEATIHDAMEAQRAADEEERMREDEQLLLEEQVRKAAERAEIARQAELILASIG